MLNSTAEENPAAEAIYQKQTQGTITVIIFTVTSLFFNLPLVVIIYIFVTKPLQLFWWFLAYFNGFTQVKIGQEDVLHILMIK